ncbi:restriction endonuclease subunit S [Corynebacterium uterequi]|uniref:Restriction endonuclease S subunit n=1 Tax=Corynebacterium uterequi TaxID=1072256 RepID=A0A0G3HDB4_9CORY|nr:restriction endonuclease subunit S [Corynebacterium uterequi]AKK11376.1 restriction endonuclease S subunit [Corynebacterium uterequi]
MSQWPMVKLGEVLAQDDTVVRIDDPSVETFLTVKLHGGGVVRRVIGDGKTPRMSSGYRVKAGQFIFSRIDARNGAFGIVPAYLNGAVVSKDFPVFSVDEDRVDPEYLYFYSVSGLLENAVKVLSSGTTNRQRVKEAALLNLALPLPPIGEQRRIAKVLSLSRRAVSRVESVLENLDSALLHMVRSVSSGSTDLLSLGDLVSIQGGLTPSRDNDEFWGGSVRWFSSKDLKQDFLSDSTEHVTESALERTSLKASSEPGVAISLRGMSLAHTVPMGIIPAGSCINQDLKLLTPKNGIPVEVLFYLIKTKTSELLARVSSSAHGTKKLDLRHLRGLEIPVLADGDIGEVQRRIAAFRSLIQINREKLERTSELQQSLTARAFSGQQ